MSEFNGGTPMEWRARLATAEARATAAEAEVERWQQVASDALAERDHWEQTYTARVGVISQAEAELKAAITCCAQNAAAVAAVRRALADELANLADDGARLSHAVVRRIEAALAGGSPAEGDGMVCPSCGWHSADEDIPDIRCSLCGTSMVYAVPSAAPAPAADETARWFTEPHEFAPRRDGSSPLCARYDYGGWCNQPADDPVHRQRAGDDTGGDEEATDAAGRTACRQVDPGAASAAAPNVQRAGEQVVDLARPFRILVTGSRDWSDRETIKLALREAIGDRFPVVVVHGDCPTGADRIAHDLVQRYTTLVRDGVPMIGIEAYPADWDRDGRAAGPRRNQRMVDAGADICLAFPLPSSRGTFDCIRRAEAAGIRVKQYAPAAAIDTGGTP